MDRSQSLAVRRVAAIVCLAAIVPTTGCLHKLLVTGMYIAKGGNVAEPECGDMEGKRVVVFCRPPSSSEYSHAGAARDIAKSVSSLLADNVKEIDVVDTREVDRWLDENDSDDYETLGAAVAADLVLRIELDHFSLYKGKTLYQGNADVTVTVYDMNDGGKQIFDSALGEVLFPRNSGVPQDKPIKQFQREFVDIVAEEVAVKFYPHDPHRLFAIDSLADR